MIYGIKYKFEGESKLHTEIISHESYEINKIEEWWINTKKFEKILEGYKKSKEFVGLELLNGNNYR